MTFWFDRSTRCIRFNWYRKTAKRNKKEYGKSDPDMRTNMVWGFHSNGAKRGNLKDTCYDCTLELGYISLGYTNWNFNREKIQSDAKIG